MGSSHALITWNGPDVTHICDAFFECVKDSRTGEDLIILSDAADLHPEQWITEEGADIKDYINPKNGDMYGKTHAGKFELCPYKYVRDMADEFGLPENVVDWDRDGAIHKWIKDNCRQIDSAGWEVSEENFKKLKAAITEVFESGKDIEVAKRIFPEPEWEYDPYGVGYWSNIKAVYEGLCEIPEYPGQLAYVVY